MTRLLTLLLLLPLCSQAQSTRLLKFKTFSRLWAPAVPGGLNNGDVLDHWRMDEASGATRVDIADSKNFTENGNVPNIVGKITNAADFSGGGAHIGSTFRNVTNTTFSWSGWVYFKSHASGQTPFGTLTASYLLESDGTAVRFGVSSNLTAITTTVTSTVPITNNTWIFVACGYDNAAKVIYIACNNGNGMETVVTASHGGGVANATDLRFGISPTATYLDGYTDSWTFWQRRLSASDISRVFNNNVGLDWPFP
jgi:hypothetical protein